VLEFLDYFKRSGLFSCFYNAVFVVDCFRIAHSNEFSNREVCSSSVLEQIADTFVEAEEQQQAVSSAP
jgi:hypothetical protein